VLGSLDGLFWPQSHPTASHSHSSLSSLSNPQGNAHPATDFNKFYERLITHLNNKFPEFRGLYMVEGVQFNAETDLPTDYPFWWGGKCVPTRPAFS
jgi:hypothetical protein